MAKIRTEIVNMADLQTGDVVRSHGALVRLGERRTFTRRGVEVVKFDGVVINRHEPDEIDRTLLSFAKMNRWHWDVQSSADVRWARVLWSDDPQIMKHLPVPVG